MFQNPYYPPYQPPAQRLQQYEQFRNPQNMLKCMAVTSIDEAQGTMIDLDGSVTVFADLSNGKIYTKQIGMDGKAILNTYELQRPKPPAADATEERFQRIERAIAENRFAQQNCCCETNRNIDAVRYENSQQTCEIANAIHAEGEATRALINANVMQDLRDRLQDEKLANSQCAQNAYLINQLQPVAKPAYITCSPYAANSGCCGSY